MAQSIASTRVPARPSSLEGISEEGAATPTRSKETISRSKEGSGAGGAAAGPTVSTTVPVNVNFSYEGDDGNSIIMKGKNNSGNQGSTNQNSNRLLSVTVQPVIGGRGDRNSPTGVQSSTGFNKFDIRNWVNTTTNTTVTSSTQLQQNLQNLYQSQQNQFQMQDSESNDDNNDDDINSNTVTNIDSDQIDSGDDGQNGIDSGADSGSAGNGQGGKNINKAHVMWGHGSSRSGHGLRTSHQSSHHSRIQSHLSSSAGGHKSGSGSPHHRRGHHSAKSGVGSTTDLGSSNLSAKNRSQMLRQRKKSVIYGGNRSVTETIRLQNRSSSQSINSETKKQGVILGVLFPCMANILGVLLFLRLPFIVGLAGISGSLGLVFVGCLTTFITALSLSAVSTNGKIRGGGSYYLISRSLGPAIGAGVGFCFYLANSIGAAMYLMGTVEAWESAMPNLQVVQPGDLNNVRFTGYILLGCCVTVVRIGISYVAKISTVLLFVVLGVIVTMYIGCLVGPTDFISFPAFDSTAAKNMKDSTNAEDQEQKARIEFLQSEEGFTESFRGPNHHFFKANWDSDYNHDQFAYPNQQDTKWGFVQLMALWFPACTGIMAGSNRSSDLADPSRAIPKGTLSAQMITSIIYLSFCVIYGWVASRELLLNDPFFAASSAWPIKDIVIYGVIASTIGAALQSLVSATRLLQAIAADGTLPFLSPFKYDSTGSKSLFASAILSSLAISIGELNAVAPILTMFFLICYFCVNACCFLLSMLNDANWRPTFKYFHWSVAFFGMLLCMILMFLISVWESLLAMSFAGMIILLAQHYSAEINWGDGFRGLRYNIAKSILLKARTSSHTKNWRPQILVLTGLTPDDENDLEGLVIHDLGPIHMASQLKHGRGLLIVGGLVYEKNFLGVPNIQLGQQGSGGPSGVNQQDVYGQDVNVNDVQSRLSAVKLRNWGNEVQSSLRDMGISGFAEILYTKRRTEGAMTLIQTAGIGPLVHNCVMFSWPYTWAVNHEVRRRFIQTVQVCSIFNNTVLICKEGHHFPLNHEIQKGNIDVWWIQADGGLLMLLPLLMRKHEVWKKCSIRLFVLVDNTIEDLPSVRMEVKSYLQEHRIVGVEVHAVGVDPHIMNVMTTTYYAKTSGGTGGPGQQGGQGQDRGTTGSTQTGTNTVQGAQYQQYQYQSQGSGVSGSDTNLMGTPSQQFAAAQSLGLGNFINPRDTVQSVDNGATLNLDQSQNINSFFNLNQYGPFSQSQNLQQATNQNQMQLQQNLQNQNLLSQQGQNNLGQQSQTQSQSQNHVPGGPGGPNPNILPNQQFDQPQAPSTPSGGGITRSLSKTLMDTFAPRFSLTQQSQYQDTRASAAQAAQAAAAQTVQQGGPSGGTPMFHQQNSLNSLDSRQGSILGQAGEQNLQQQTNSNTGESNSNSMFQDINQIQQSRSFANTRSFGRSPNFNQQSNEVLGPGFGRPSGTSGGNYQYQQFTVSDHFGITNQSGQNTNQNQNQLNSMNNENLAQQLIQNQNQNTNQNNQNNNSSDAFGFPQREISGFSVSEASTPGHTAGDGSQTLGGSRRLGLAKNIGGFFSS